MAAISAAQSIVSGNPEWSVIVSSFELLTPETAAIRIQEVKQDLARRFPDRPDIHEMTHGRSPKRNRSTLRALRIPHIPLFG
jgi:hypothetical protein